MSDLINRESSPRRETPDPFPAVRPTYVARVPRYEFIPKMKQDVAGRRRCCLFRVKVDGTIAPVKMGGTKTMRVDVYNVFAQDIGNGCYIPVSQEVDGRWIVVYPECPLEDLSPDGFCTYGANDDNTDWLLLDSACAPGATCTPPADSLLPGHRNGVDETWTECDPTTSTTTTSTTGEPTPHGPTTGHCDEHARCKWTWSGSGSYWVPSGGDCRHSHTTRSPTTPDPSNPTTSTTTSTSTTSTSTTTTECPCPHTTTTSTTGDPGTSTTTTSSTSTTSTSTTTTAEPGDCGCPYPSFCGEIDGECTYTYCSHLVPEQPEDCQTTTTTFDPDDCESCLGTFDPSDCPPPPNHNPDDNGTCDCVVTFRCFEDFSGGTFWGMDHIDGTLGPYCCIPDRMVNIPPCSCGETATAECFHCQLPNGNAEPCAGDCWYANIGGVWVYTPGGTGCAGGGTCGCGCTPPSGDPASGPCSNGGVAKVGCGVPRGSICDPGGAGGDGGGGPGGNCHPCHRTCLPTSTTTTEDPLHGFCSSGCRVSWDPGDGFWSVVGSGCTGGCTCILPTQDGGDCIETRESLCLQPRTTSTTTSTTSTSTTSTTTSTTSTSTTSTTTSTTPEPFGCCSGEGIEFCLTITESECEEDHAGDWLPNAMCCAESGVVGLHCVSIVDDTPCGDFGSPCCPGCPCTDGECVCTTTTTTDPTTGGCWSMDSGCCQDGVTVDECFGLGLIDPLFQVGCLCSDTDTCFASALPPCE